MSFEKNAGREIADIQVYSISLGQAQETEGPCEHLLQYSEQFSSKGDLLWVCSNCGAERPPGAIGWWTPDAQ